jgi:hypothetical protein
VKRLDIRVVGQHHTPSTVPTFYIGRPSPLGNPYLLSPGAPASSRRDAITLYEKWLRERIQLGDREVLDELAVLILSARVGPICLQCFCYPLPCHGDVIARVIQERAQIAFEAQVEAASRENRKFWFIFGYRAGHPELVDVSDGTDDVFEGVPEAEAALICDRHNATLTPKERQ